MKASVVHPFGLPDTLRPREIRRAEAECVAGTCAMSYMRTQRAMRPSWNGSRAAADYSDAQQRAAVQGHMPGYAGNGVHALDGVG